MAHDERAARPETQTFADSSYFYQVSRVARDTFTVNIERIRTGTNVTVIVNAKNAALAKREAAMRMLRKLR